ncbi:MAG: HAMP domain-containing sensor histidine kinase [Lachnospiraceae bacterium]|nr:HAMP domain-containing sensor histidine kinase [Lachnospiraceae bacterium]
MDKRAIEKLKRKFVGIAALSFMLVMIFIAGLIYVGNLWIVNSEINDVLTYIVDNDGELPENGQAKKARDSTFENLQKSDSSDSKKTITDKLTNFFGLQGSYDTPEFLYSTRFFSVIYNAKDHSVVEVKTSHMASVDNTEAVSIATKIEKRNFDFGRYGDFYYKKSTDPDGKSILVVMDCTSQVSLSKRILILSLIFIGFGMVLSSIILRALSSRLVAPEIRNSENQKRFITNASHELKTPLAVIRANTELTEAMSGETEWTKATLRQVDRLQGLIQNLVLITRAQEQDSKDSRVDMDISSAARETVETFLPLASQEGLKVTMDIPKDLHMVAEGGQIRQLVSLFVDNAIKYCDPDGEICIRISQPKRGRYTLFQFSNSYAAGKDVDYTRFFDRFYREDKSHNTDKGGYGIGLSIAETIVEQYHGYAGVNWKDGVITFICRLYG